MGHWTVALTMIRPWRRDYERVAPVKDATSMIVLMVGKGKLECGINDKGSKAGAGWGELVGCGQNPHPVLETLVDPVDVAHSHTNNETPMHRHTKTQIYTHV